MVFNSIRNPRRCRRRPPSRCRPSHPAPAEASSSGARSSPESLLVPFPPRDPTDAGTAGAARATHAAARTVVCDLGRVAREERHSEVIEPTAQRDSAGTAGTAVAPKAGTAVADEAVRVNASVAAAAEEPVASLAAIAAKRVVLGIVVPVMDRRGTGGIRDTAAECGPTVTAIATITASPVLAVRAGGPIAPPPNPPLPPLAPAPPIA